MKSAYNFAQEIAAYNSCADACEHCAAACLAERNVVRSRCIELCRDCADLCRMSAMLILRNSDYAVIFAQLCRVACLACAEECASHDSDPCQRCARTCQVCAEDAQINDPGNEDPGSQLNDAPTPP